jgi:hypothetical protein
VSALLLVSGLLLRGYGARGKTPTKRVDD